MASAPSLNKTTLAWGNTIQALTASQTAVRGAHPTRLLLDEIDEMKLPILEAAQGQPMDRDGVRAQTVMSSTHQHPDGTVTAMRRRAAEMGWPVSEWCYRETLAPHGWLTEDQVVRKQAELSRTMWAVEYELQEPSAEGRAIDPPAVERMFDATLGTHIPAGDLEHTWRGQPGPPAERACPDPAGAWYCIGVDWAQKRHLGDLSDAYLQDYQVRQFRSQSTARGRTAHLAAFFGRAARAATLTTYQIRQYQLTRRAAGAATGTINRETSALHRMCTLAVHWGWLDTVPGFPDRLRENPPRQGFFEHPEYLAVRVRLPAPWQDILDVAYYSGWRKQEILGLTWDEIDEAGGVIRLSPARSKTLVGRILPISQPIAEALARRRARRDPDSLLVFHRDGIPVRRWRTAWRTACQAAGVPTRFLHDCRRTAARNLIRANVPERVAMLLTGHKSRAIFDRYNIIHEQELLDAGDQLVAYLAQQAQATPARRWPHTAGPAAPRTASPLRLVRRGTA